MEQAQKLLRVPTAKFSISLLLMAFFLLVIDLTSGFSQASGSLAELRGQVTDATGAIIPNAKVTLTDTAKGTSRNLVTDAEGNYIFIGLLPSLYEVKVEAAGFAAKFRLDDNVIRGRRAAPIDGWGLSGGLPRPVPIRLST